jgi:hypothetical protein
MEKGGQEKDTAQPIKKRLPKFLEAFLMLFVPLIGFFLFSLFTYPLHPHCSLGNGVLGCTTMCKATSYFEDGRPSSYEVTPCFHEEASAFQIFSYNQQIPYYLLFLFPIVILFFILGSEGFYNLLVRTALYPYFLFRENKKNKKFISRFITTIIFLPIFLEWVAGYVVLAMSLLGKGFF